MRSHVGGPSGWFQPLWVHYWHPGVQKWWFWPVCPIPALRTHFLLKKAKIIISGPLVAHCALNIVSPSSLYARTTLSEPKKLAHKAGIRQTGQNHHFWAPGGPLCTHIGWNHPDGPPAWLNIVSPSSLHARTTLSEPKRVTQCWNLVNWPKLLFLDPWRPIVHSIRARTTYIPVSMISPHLVTVIHAENWIHRVKNYLTTLFDSVDHRDY